MKLIRILGIVIVALVVIVVAIPFFIDVNQFRPKLETQLTSALGRPVTVGNLKLSLWSGSVEADNLSIGDDPAFSKTPFLTAKSLGAGVEIMPLLTSRKVNVTAITIDQPEISLLQTPEGKWNYASLGSKSAPAASPQTAPAPSSGSPLDLSVNLVKITNGRLTVGKTSGHAKPMILDKVNIEVKDFSPSTAMPFSLTADVSGGGSIKLDGKAGPIPDDVEHTPMNASLKITGLDLLASGAVDPAVGVGGIASIDGTAESDGKVFSANGAIKVDKVKLAKGGTPASRPLEFDYTLHHDLASRAGSLTRGDVHVGSAKASLTGTYVPQGETVAIKANLTGDAMAVQELEAMLPALNISLPAGSKIEGGTALVKMNVDGPLDNLVTTGTLGLNNLKLAGFDLGKKLSVIQALAGIKSSPTTEIQVLSGNVKNSNAGTTIDDLKLVAPDIGELTGSGTISPSKALDFKMRVAVKSGLLPAALGGQAGIPFFIHGTAEDPKFEPDLKGIAASEVKDLKGTAEKAAGGLLNNFLNKKKNQ
jgi:AsmA protein